MNTIKTVGRSGQISLGKKYAGQTVMLNEIDTGVWIVKLGRFIPDNEKWLDIWARQKNGIPRLKVRMEIPELP